MAGEGQAVLDGIDVGGSVGIRHVFDAHVGLHPKRSSALPLAGEGGMSGDLGHDGAVRKTGQHVMFMVIPDGKRDGDHGHFPIVVFQQDAMR